MLRTHLTPAMATRITLLLLAVTVCCKSEGPQARGGSGPGKSRTPRRPGGEPAQDAILGKLDGWRLQGEVRSYPRRQLFKHINGGAELYLQQGFHHSEAARYLPLEKSEGPVRVSLFQMDSPRSAFGIFSTERPAGAAPSENVKSGYSRGPMLAFWHGRHYVKLIAAGPAAVQVASLGQLASIISGRLGAAADPPAELKLLPDQGRVEGSERLTARNFIGSTAFPQVFSAQYTVGKGEATLFLAVLTDVDRATEALAAHRHLVQRHGGTSKQLEPAQGSMLQLSSDGLGYCLLARRLKTIAGLHADQAPDDEAAARELLLALLGRLEAR